MAEKTEEQVAAVQNENNTHDFEDDRKLKDPHLEEIVIARLTEDEIYELSKNSLAFKSKAMLRIFLVMFVMACGQASYGVDWAVIGNINSFPAWHNYFDFQNSGGTLGLLNAMMNIGSLCGSLFLGFGDKIGRRGINFIGNAIVIIGAVVQGSATNMSTFTAGRFLLGFGAGIMSCPQYMAEISPTHMRGRLVGLFGACFQVGSMAMTGAMLGFAKESTVNASWRIPLFLETILPGIVCLSIYFCPETPRYLVMRGKIEEAKKVIAKYHTTSGDINEPLVNVVISQIEYSLENDRTQNRQAWNLTVFFRKATWYRTMILVLYSFFQSWNGGGIIGNYLSPALDTIGITGAMEQVGVNLGTVAVYFVFTCVGSYVIDIAYRRTLLFAGIGLFVILQTAVTITSWRYNIHPSNAAAGLTIFWIFLFQAASATLIATMHNLYPVEILSLSLRARGMALYGIIQGGAGACQSYGISVGIQKIGYKIWTVYIVYNALQFIAVYFLFPETFGLSLEEVDAVFETNGVRPVKMSLDMKKAKIEKARLEREAEGSGGVVA